MSGTAAPTKEGLEQELESVISAHGINVKASTIVDFLADKGVIKITNSTIYAPEQISYAAKGGSVFFGGTGKSSTDSTIISTEGEGSGISIKGNGAVKQNSDGSISFHTGPGGEISIGVNPSSTANNVSFGTAKPKK